MVVFNLCNQPYLVGQSSVIVFFFFFDKSVIVVGHIEYACPSILCVHYIRFSLVKPQHYELSHTTSLLSLLHIFKHP